MLFRSSKTEADIPMVLGAPEPSAPETSNVMDAFDFGSISQPAPAPTEEKKDAIDFDFGASEPSNTNVVKEEVHTVMQSPQPMPQQQPMMPQQPMPQQQPMLQPAGEDPFATNPQQRMFYQNIFLQLDKDKDHKISHEIGRASCRERV